MMRSLYSGVAGLTIHQTKMDVIGNNIANVNTVGYKAQRVSFSELFYQSTQAAGGPSENGAYGGTNAKQVGLGAAVGQISTNITAQGGAQSTGNAFDAMINGDSFFIVQSEGNEYYTKAGNFTIDGNGNLVTGTGDFVMGYTAARNEESGDFYLQTDKLRPICPYGETYMTTPPAQTTAAVINGNINSEDKNFAVDGSGIVSTTLYVYDSLGNKYGIDFRVTQVSPTEYTMTPATVYFGTEALEDVSAVFSGDGINAGSLTLMFDGTKGTITNDPKNFTLNITDGTNNLEAFSQDIDVDFSSLTCYGSTTTLTADSGDVEKFGAGKAVGKMISLGISQDGGVVASYSNGDKMQIGLLMTAQFSNAAGLEKVGDNLFATTLNSGATTIQSIDAAGQSISSGVVEMSNVDLASEFTDMIVTQRGFQANSRIITTSDSMIEELLSLKR